MAEIPEEAVHAAAQAVLAHPWARHRRTAHQTHQYDYQCAICKGDVASILAVAAPILAAHIANRLAMTPKPAEASWRVWATRIARETFPPTKEQQP